MQRLYYVQYIESGPVRITAFQHASVGGDMHKLHEQIIGDLKAELMSLPGVCYS